MRRLDGDVRGLHTQHNQRKQPEEAQGGGRRREPRRRVQGRGREAEPERRTYLHEVRRSSNDARERPGRAPEALCAGRGDDDERRVETARARAEAAGKVALEDLARLRGVDVAAVAALRAAATAAVAALQKRRRLAQTRARARRREARTTYARTAPARTVRSHYDVLGISRDAGAAGRPRQIHV